MFLPGAAGFRHRTLLQLQEDPVHQPGADQGAEAFPEEHQGRVDEDDQIPHDEVDRRHEHRHEEEVEAGDDRVAHQGRRRVFKAGEKRENIEKLHQPEDGEDRKCGRQDRPEGAGAAGAQVEEDVGVKSQKRAEGGEEEPDDGGLAEVVAEGAEEGAGDAGLLIAHHFLHDAVEGGGGSADRHERDAAEEPEGVQKHGVADAGEKTHRRAVRIE